MRTVPVNTPLIDAFDVAAVSKVVSEGWISSEGPEVALFERKFATFCNRSFGAAVSNGTAALEIAIESLNLPKGSEVIIPDFSIISVVQAVLKAGLVPRLVDVDLYSFNITLDQIKAAVNDLTQAVIVVHTYGLAAEIDLIEDFCEKSGLLLIEDAAEAHGQTCNGRICGSFGKLSIFSFYPNKHITTGEGGMIVTNDLNLYESAKKLRNLCFESDGRRFKHYALGWNYRMTNIQAALGLSQLSKIDMHIEKKRFIGRYYRDNILSSRHFIIPLDSNSCSTNIYWVFTLVFEDVDILFVFIEYLNKCGIGHRPFFYPISKQPVFENDSWIRHGDFKNSHTIAESGIYLPSGLGLSIEDLEYVVRKINAFITEYE
jgi:perosamine synthetase